MKFFKDIKNDLEELAGDLTTVEHAMLKQNDDGSTEVLIYRKQEADGDSVIYIAPEEIDQEVLVAFNDLFQAGIISRQGILQAIIKIFK